MITCFLIGGYIYKSADGGKVFCDKLFSTASSRPVKILDCLFGNEEGSWKKKYQNHKQFFLNNSSEFELELATIKNFIEQLKKSDVLFLQGGNPQLILSLLDASGDWIKELKGKVLIASSGGVDAIATYYGVGKTMNIGEGRGLLPIKFIPHWKSEYYSLEEEIDWENLKEKLQSYKENIELVVLGDTEFLIKEIRS